jgi:hypothetical protein
MKIIKFSILIAILSLSGCFPTDPDYYYEYDTIITDTPANLQKINSTYDDYNSALPYDAIAFPLVFSSSRISSGVNFDFVYQYIEISYHERDNTLNFSYIFNNDQFLNTLLGKVNSSYNELGPYTYFISPSLYFLYANDETGNYDIKFTYVESIMGGYPTYPEAFNGPFAATAINSESDDLYPSIDQNSNTLYFCSNRDQEQFDIYKLPVSTTSSFPEFLQSDYNPAVEKVSVLSSDFNDKCPFVNNKLMIFVSDREGGFGGYDLYYSRLVNNQWTEPVNFGDKINSEHNEYRPIAFEFSKFNIMIFSSDRPGGKGGYDLYAVTIPIMIN